MSFPWTRRVHARVFLATLVCLVALGCGDNNNPTTVTPTNQQNLLNGFDELAAFGDELVHGPGGQIVQNPSIVELLNTVVPGFAGVVPLVVPSPVELADALRWGKALQTPPRTALGLEDHTGTYERDATDTTLPFPGWVLVQADDPPDGLVFRFDLQDDIVAYTEQGMPVPLQGAVRFLGLVVDAGVPENPDDDILTHVVFEVAASPFGGIPFERVHIPLTIVLGPDRQPQSVAVGDPAAVNAQNPDAAVLGDVLLAVQVGLDPGSGPSRFDLQALAQLFDSVASFSVRADLQVTDLDLQSGLMSAITLGFGWGTTAQPATPPWQISGTADDFVQDVGTGDIYASIDGSIERDGAPQATFQGSTHPTTVVVDGNEVECPGVLVTFTDDPENPLNICEALPLLVGLALPFP